MCSHEKDLFDMLDQGINRQKFYNELLKQLFGEYDEIFDDECDKDEEDFDDEYDEDEEEIDYQDRFVIEYLELKARYESLHRILVKYDAGTLDFEPDSPIELLKSQAKIMGEYLYILETRAEIENIDLDLDED